MNGILIRDAPGARPPSAGESTNAELYCRILGSTEVEVGGAAIPLGGAVSRRILGALLAAEGRPVADDRLADQVWDRPPANTINALRVAISRLRRNLGPAAAKVLLRTGVGYLLRVPLASTDHGMFTGLVQQGVSQLAVAEYTSATTAFESALALWRGDPWSELGDSPHLAGVRARLAELREVAIEESLAARLACGDTATAVAALHAAVAETPYRERRWELLALGLYRSGRQAHALAELRRVRRVLITDVGVEPGPALRALERRMLAQDPELIRSHRPDSSMRPEARAAGRRTVV